LPTLGLVGRRGVLALGAAAGAVGWGTTAVLAGQPGLVADPETVVVAVWAALVVLLGGVGGLLATDAVRFSRPMLAWAPANGLAVLATLGVLFGPLPDPALPAAWAISGAIGYAVTARVTGDRLYLAAAFVELSTLGAVAVVPPAGLFVLLGVAHALPLSLAVAPEDPLAPAAVVLAWTVALLVVR
jgi:hypothetical protein